MSNNLEFGKNFNYNEIQKNRSIPNILKSYGLDIEKSKGPWKKGSHKEELNDKLNEKFLGKDHKTTAKNTLKEDNKSSKHISDMSKEELHSHAEKMGIKDHKDLSHSDLKKKLLDSNVDKQIEDFKNKKEPSKEEKIKYHKEQKDLHETKSKNVKGDSKEYIEHQKQAKYHHDKLTDLEKAMEAGTTTGTDTTNKPSNGAALKKEDVEKSDIVDFSEDELGKSQQILGLDLIEKAQTKDKENKDDKFYHHRNLAGYHYLKAKEWEEKGFDLNNSTNKDVRAKGGEGNKEAQHHTKMLEQHLGKAKELHDKEKHGEWNKTIPKAKEALDYGNKYDEDLNSQHEIDQPVLEKKDKLKKSFQFDIEKAISNIDFDQIVSLLFNVQNQLEHCHRKTKSEPKHEALGDAYEAVAGLKDTIIEYIIGSTGKQYSKIELATITSYTSEMCYEAASNLCIIAKQIEQFANDNKLPMLGNLAQDLDGVGVKLKYKLSLNNSDEKSDLKKAIDVLGFDFLEKAEGSRGGKIIGHTKSGKPIYASAHESHKSFSKQDSLDAAKEHDSRTQMDHPDYSNEKDQSKINRKIKQHKQERDYHQGEADLYYKDATGDQK